MLFANGKGIFHATIDSAPDAVWFDLVNPTDQERAAVERAVGFPLPTRESISEIENSSRVSTEEGVLCLNSPIAYRDPEGHSAVTSVGFVLSQHRLVTIRFADIPVFNTFAERFAHAKNPCSAEAFAGIVEAVVDRIADVLERMGAELDALSKRTFRRGAPGQRRSSRLKDDDLRQILTGIGQVGDTISNLRDTLLGLTRIVAYTQQTAATWIPAEIKERLTTTRQDTASLNDYDQQLTAKTSFLLDAVLGFINIEQNDTFKVLTVVSVAGIPPTFVVGLYGMNFKNMPEYDWAWGYEWGWAMIVVSIVIPLIWFRVKGWI